MSTAFSESTLETVPALWTIADVLTFLPEFPANRIRTIPAPGTATEDDLLAAEDRGENICELIDGTLVEKTMATYESELALALGYFFHAYLEANNLGTVTGPDGQLKILPSQIRVPDVAFIRWERFPGGRKPKSRIYAIAPDLAVEILSEGNTKAEMTRKLREYFLAGVQLVWYIDPPTRSTKAYTAADAFSEIGPDGSLDGGTVLPGFSLPLAKLFARVEMPDGY